MNIALFGYGRMGQAIEKIALERGHHITQIINKQNAKVSLSDVDIAIEFSLPEAAVSNITTCLEQSVPVVSGTTGWLASYEAVTALCNTKKGAFIYASNFSLGVNIFFELNKKLAAMMQHPGTYQVSTEEIHHTKKLDAPSGTAITIAEGIIENSAATKWELNTKEKSTDQNPEIVPITSKRIGDVPGTHIVTYDSEVDQIEIKHTANNRQGFALGAVIAAEWLQNKTGVYSMKDVLGL